MKEFPIMTKKGKEYIPYDIIKPHEEQALKNHCGQTLDRLAARGGLSWAEAYAVLTDSKFPYGDQYISDEFYEKKVKEIVSNATVAGYKNIFVQTYITYISLPVQAEKPPAIQN